MMRMYSSGDCLYSILGVNQDANDSELKLAYFKLAKQYHPDVNSSNEATQMFIDINNAYEVLADKDKRTQYDERRKKKAYRHEKRPHDKSMEDIIKFWNKMMNSLVLRHLFSLDSMNTDEFRSTDRPFDIHCTKVYGGNHSGAHNYKKKKTNNKIVLLFLFAASMLLFVVSYMFFQNRQDLIIKQSRELSLSDANSLNGGNHNNMKFLFYRLLEKQRNGENTVGPTKPPKD